MITKLSRIPYYPHINTASITINERLPSHLEAPILLECKYAKITEHNIPILVLSLSGKIGIHCQRCAQPFNYDYENELRIALCSTDEIASRLMDTMEVVVTDLDSINLVDIITDELYLYVPEKHENCGE